MATIKCPKCREKIKAGAVVCKHCKYELSPDEVDVSKTTERVSFWFKIILLVALAFLVKWCVDQPAATPEQLAETRQAFGLAETVLPPDVNVDLTDEYAQNSKRSVCAERYPANFTMRAACERNAEDGRRDYLRIWAAHSPDVAMKAALSTCFDRYTSGLGTNFSMAGACARNQLEGYIATAR